MKKLFFSTIGNENFGDESMIINYIKKSNFKDEDIEIITEKPENVKDKHKEYIFYNAIENFNLNPKSKILFIFGMLLNKSPLEKSVQLLHPMDEYESFTMAGGGNLNSNYINTLIIIYTIAKKFKDSGKKVYFRPQSVGPFSGKWDKIARLILKKIINMSDEFYTRENESYKLATSIASENKEKVKLKIDDAWNLNINSFDNKDIESILNSQMKKIGISIRPWDKEEEFFNYFMDFSKCALSKGYMLVFVPIAFGGEESYIDNAFIKKELIGMDNVYFIEDYVNLSSIYPENVKWIVSKLDYCLGLSYHFNVFANSLSKHTIGLYSDPYYYIKNKGFYDLIQLPDNLVSIHDVKPEELLDKLLSCKTTDNP